MYIIPIYSHSFRIFPSSSINKFKTDINFIHIYINIYTCIHPARYKTDWACYKCNYNVQEKILLLFQVP